MAWVLKVLEVDPIDKAQRIRVRFSVVDDESGVGVASDEAFFPAGTSYDDIKNEIVSRTKEFIARFEQIKRVKGEITGKEFSATVNDDGSVTLTDEAGNVY